MTWYTHPDTLCAARARGMANKTGHTRESVGWLRAYRDAYKLITGKNAKDYIQKLDEQLEAKTNQR